MMIIPILTLACNCIHPVIAKTVYRGFNDVVDMPIARSDMTATAFRGALFNDGPPRIFVVGGCVADQLCPYNDWCFCPEITARCDAYLPDENIWVSCPDAPRQRSRHAAVSLGGKLYLLGGRAADDSLITEIDMFDPILNIWTTLAYNWVNATSDSGAFVDEAIGDGFIYLVGGYDGNYFPMSTLQRFDPISLTLETLSPMENARGDLGAITVPVHKPNVIRPPEEYYHYVIGGFGNNICEPLDVVERYDILSDAWTTIAALDLSRGDMALSFLENKLFVIGGETKQANTCNATSFQPGVSIPVNDVERLESRRTANAWYYEEDIPSERFRFVAAAHPIDNTIFLFGGQGAIRKISDSDMSDAYYPVLNTTMLYVPQSIANAEKNPLNDGEIAGAIVALVVVYFGFRKYRDYTYAPDCEDPVAGTKRSRTDDGVIRFESHSQL